MITVGIAKKGSDPFAICDVDTTYGEMVQVFINWVEQNPAKLQSERIIGVMYALIPILHQSELTI